MLINKISLLCYSKMEKFMFNLKKVYLCFLISAILIALPEFISSDNQTTEYLIKGFLYFFGAIIGLIGAWEFKQSSLNHHE
jgi:hypothetical protein